MYKIKIQMIKSTKTGAYIMWLWKNSKLKVSKYIHNSDANSSGHQHQQYWLILYCIAGSYIHWRAELSAGKIFFIIHIWYRMPHIDSKQPNGTGPTITNTVHMVHPYPIPGPLYIVHSNIWGILETVWSSSVAHNRWLIIILSLWMFIMMMHP